MEKTNIVLIGMPGVGKSTAGVILAKIIGYRFIDTDLVIQEKEGKLLREIIEEQGAEGFIRTESRIHSQLITARSVIATGGSVIYGAEAMRHLRETGIVAYLKLPYEELSHRLTGIRGRGVVLREGQDLYGLYRERTPLYEKYADFIIDEEGLSIEETVRLLADKYDEAQNRIAASGDSNRRENGCI